MNELALILTGIFTTGAGVCLGWYGHKRYTFYQLKKVQQMLIKTAMNRFEKKIINSGK